jgi:hypothetical protein
MPRSSQGFADPILSELLQCLSRDSWGRGRVVICFDAKWHDVGPDYHVV